MKLTEEQVKEIIETAESNNKIRELGAIGLYGFSKEIHMTKETFFDTFTKYKLEPFASLDNPRQARVTQDGYTFFTLLNFQESVEKMKERGEWPFPDVTK